ncbi:MAG: SDR family NAD(P)-dependent oxidoreductase, partial [Alphaproteobacteria bacterium]
MADRLKGKVALVFGAGSVGPGWGNGKATAVAFAREGAIVHAVDVNPAAAEETRTIIAGEGGACLAHAADVRRSDDIARVVAATVERHGRIDVLHNNVGMTAMGGAVELDEAEWRRILDLNATSVFLARKHVLPIMRAQRKGAIVNISSLAAIRVGRYPYIAYNAAKAAVNQMTRAIAIENARQGIRCNAIMPGLMDTPLIHQQIAGQYSSTEEMIKARNEGSPTGKMGDGWDVAWA